MIVMSMKRSKLTITQGQRGVAGAQMHSNGAGAVAGARGCKLGLLWLGVLWHAVQLIQILWVPMLGAFHVFT